MPTYQRTSVIDADLETVWDFYDGVEELEVLTPDWMGLQVPRVVGPDGRLDPDGYEVGTEIHLRSPLLELLPAGEWVVRITEHEPGEERASFVDEQVGGRGPFERWRHTHRFAALDGKTVLHDRVSYRLPGVGDLPLATPSLAATLWYRHRRTRTLLAE
ncbi:SRPBCC family protein [Natrinema amylolyticum]|uniref:SRPBCC family protein n=1 Tax=Natrinema amylolyticum TaxID=2878679 RepID=UPI001CFA226C|nr:SRPBCC family protein [Natrinema amylolyticum]